MSNIVEPHLVSNFFATSATAFVVHISRFPNLSFAAQEVALPGFSAQPPKQGMPGSDIHHLPTKLIYDPLTITFMVDEDLSIHREMHNWLVGITGGALRTEKTAEFVESQADYIWPDYDARKTFTRSGSTTATITFLNGGNVPIFKAVFFNVIPAGVGPIQYSTTTADPNQVLSSTATFNYDYFEFFQLRR